MFIIGVTAITWGFSSLGKEKDRETAFNTLDPRGSSRSEKEVEKEHKLHCVKRG